MFTKSVTAMHNALSDLNADLLTMNSDKILFEYYFDMSIKKCNTYVDQCNIDVDQYRYLLCLDKFRNSFALSDYGLLIFQVINRPTRVAQLADKLSNYYQLERDVDFTIIATDGKDTVTNGNTNLQVMLNANGFLKALRLSENGKGLLDNYYTFLQSVIYNFIQYEELWKISNQQTSSQKITETSNYDEYKDLDGDSDDSAGDSDYSDDERVADLVTKQVAKQAAKQVAKQVAKQAAKQVTKKMITSLLKEISTEELLMEPLHSQISRIDDYTTTIMLSTNHIYRMFRLVINIVKFVSLIVIISITVWYITPSTNLLTDLLAMYPLNSD